MTDATQINVRLLFFGAAREAAGCSAEELTVHAPATATSVFAEVVARHPELQRLGRQAHEQFDITHIGIVHRTGRLEIGETSVVISVSAPHRRAAFAACEWAIRELKRTVPIWKKEFYEDGEVWVEGARE